MLKIPVHNQWTKDEDKFLINNYKNLSVDELADRLSRHRLTIVNKLNDLGLRTPSKRKWTQDELDFIIENYPTKRCEWCADQLNRSKRSVYTKAERLGVHVQWEYRYEDNDGYIQVVLPNSHKRFEHRFNLEKHLNRNLDKREKVHHLNEIKTDNRIKNLIILSNKDHSTLHGLVNKKDIKSLEGFVKNIKSDEDKHKYIKWLNEFKNQ